MHMQSRVILLAKMPIPINDTVVVGLFRLFEMPTRLVFMSVYALCFRAELLCRYNIRGVVIIIAGWWGYYWL